MLVDAGNFRLAGQFFFKTVLLAGFAVDNCKGNPLFAVTLKGFDVGSVNGRSFGAVSMRPAKGAFIGST